MTTQLVDVLVARLSESTRHGLDHKRLRRLPELAATGTVLLVGSHARGEATAGSDLDIAVLCDRTPERERGVFGYVSVVGDALVIDDGIAPVLNLEFIRRDALRDISDVLAAVPGNAEQPCLANLGPVELRTVERVSSGVVLREDPVDRALLSAVDLAKARANTAALALILCAGHLRAASSADGDPHARSVRLREAMLELLVSEVNALGVLTFDYKHLARRAAGLVNGGPARVLGLLERPATGIEGAVRIVQDALREVLASTAREPDRRLVDTLLRPRRAVVAAAVERD